MKKVVPRCSFPTASSSRGKTLISGKFCAGWLDTTAVTICPLASIAGINLVRACPPTPTMQKFRNWSFIISITGKGASFDPSP